MLVPARRAIEDDPVTIQSDRCASWVRGYVRLIWLVPGPSAADVHLQANGRLCQMASQYITLACPQCAKQLRAPASAAGKTGKCNGCGSQIAIPHGSAEAVARTASASPALPVPAPPRSTAPPNLKPARGQSPAQPTVADDASLQLGEIGEAQSDFSEALSALIAEGDQSVRKHVASSLSVAEVAKSITQGLPKRPVSHAYRIHLLLVACAMAALPMFYLAFVAGAGFGLFYYISQVMPELLSHTPGGRAAVLYFLAVSAPAVAGTILVLFLIKPLFFRIRDERRRRSLTRQSQPLLFELVDRICDATGAPKPQRIDVDYQVNASAQPLGGIWSVATGKMVLTIGVPLIAGLSARQLAGVLAHEFGHFSQKVGMGATLVIRKVNLWFMRVVYQRDTLDQMLDSLIAESDWRLGIILQLANLCVIFSRGVLWCFMMLGHGISAALMRQMEFDADRYEYGLVGSRTFAETALELQLLGASQAVALQAMLGFFQKGRLADDMIALGNHFQEQLPSDARRQIEASRAEEKGSWLATHPTDRARIARAQQAAAEGIFKLDRPARELVRHYDEICKGVTWDFYRDQIGSHVAPQQLTPTSQLMEATTT